VQVLQHDEQRRVGGDASQEVGDVLGDAEAAALGVERGRLDVRQPRAQRGHELYERARRRVDARGEDVVRQRLGPAAQHLHPRPERRRAVVVGATSPEHAVGRQRRERHDLLDEPCLADARFPDDGDDAAASGARFGELGEGGVQLARAADEGRSDLQRRHDAAPAPLAFCKKGGQPRQPRSASRI
jgi:hypothetical protein